MDTLSYSAAQRIYRDQLHCSAPWLVVDGPEKAGKSTVLERIPTQSPIIRWGDEIRNGLFRGPEDFLNRFLWDQVSEVPRIWDRSWIANYVYGTLGARPDINTLQAWEAEWVLGRALPTCGLGVILLGPGPQHTQGLRDETDLLVDSCKEYDLFEEYGHSYKHYAVYTNRHNRYDLESLSNNLMGLATHLYKRAGISPLACTSPRQDCPVVFLESAKEDYTQYYEGILPWSGTQGTTIAALLQDDAFDCCWARPCEEMAPRLSKARAVFTLGTEADTFAIKYATKASIIAIPEHDFFNIRTFRNYIRRINREYENQPH